jgi:hypothetical protein
MDNPALPHGLDPGLPSWRFERHGKSAINFSPLQAS